jgi:transposase
MWTQSSECLSGKSCERLRVNLQANYPWEGSGMPASSLSLCSDRPFDVTDADWVFVEPLLTVRSKKGRPLVHNFKLVYEAIVYVLRGGIPWRMLPDEFPPWKTVYWRFRKWSDEGIWERMTDALRQQVRLELGRNPEPTAGCIDSQSVESRPSCGAVGYDAGKKIGGRKGHIVVDTEGLLVAATVTPACVQDPTAAPEVLGIAKSHAPTLALIWGDGRYGGKQIAQAESDLGITVEVVSRPKAAQGFVLLPRRWVVERTFAWINRCRRLARDWERSSWASVAFIYIAASNSMARRLAKFTRWQSA